MSMSRITATIALVGYVLGGWLLPALHQHAAHSETHGCQHQHEHAAALVAAAEEAETASSCCHGHEHSDSGSDVLLAETRLSVASQSLTETCDAMCLLCQISARKFSPLDRPLVSLSAVAHCQLAIAATEQPVVSARLAVDCPRGPPARLN